MADIVIRGGDAEAAARAMRAALREIFEADALQSTAREATPGRRSLEVVALILTIPPAAIAAVDLIARTRLRERLGRLTAAAETQAKATGARLLIDPGDGKPIPLEHARQEIIFEALAALEKRKKG
ncbi:MAG: hypothetical protein ACHQRJ_07095 [Alphaproteobacteria bacterium]